MGNAFNSHSTINSKIIDAISNNNSDKLIEYIKRYNTDTNIIRHIQIGPNRSIPILNYLLICDKCSDVIPLLLKYKPNVTEKYYGESFITLVIKNDKVDILILLEQYELIRINDAANLPSIDYNMNSLHSYKISTKLLSYCTSNKIDLKPTPEIQINLITNFIIRHGDIHISILDNSAFKLLLKDFSYLLSYDVLYDISHNKEFMSNLSQNNIQCFTFLHTQLFQKYNCLGIYNDGNTLLSWIVVNICKNKYKLTNNVNQIIKFLIDTGYHYNHINNISEKSIKDIIIETDNVNTFITTEKYSELFNIDDIFINNIQTGQINESVPSHIKNKMYTIYGYTGTGLHHILNLFSKCAIRNKFSISLFDEIHDINIIDSLNRTYVDILIQHKHKNMIEFLIENGASLNRISTFYSKHKTLHISPLTYVCCYAQSDIALLLINNPNIDVNLKNPDGSTALLKSTELKKVQIPLKLITAGADSTIKDSNSKLALDYATNPKLISQLKKNVKIGDYYNTNLKSSPPEDGTDTLCKICMDNKIDILFYPCKHALCCNTCYKQLLLSSPTFSCTLCKQKVDFVLDFIL